MILLHANREIVPLMHLMIDGHLDLSMNALEWNRDLRLPVMDLRRREEGLKDKPDRGGNTVSLPALRAGNVGLVVATQIARQVRERSIFPGWYSQEQAWAQTQGQLAWYRAMEEAGELRQIVDLTSLEAHLECWERDAGADKAIGYLLSLEGADSLLHLGKLEQAHGYGLRAIGPAHYGPGVYANGTESSGSLEAKGLELIREMDRLGFILDVTHLTDEAFWQVMDLYQGPVWASHSNCRAIAPHQRQLSDEQIRALVERGAVIGVALDAWMLVPNWIRWVSSPHARQVTLQTVADHMDHICQITGNAGHVGIGSDLDGGFGIEQSPTDLDTIADLQRLPGILGGRGYDDGEIEGICRGNWLRFLRAAWK